MAEMSVVTASILSRPPPLAQLATVSAEALDEAVDGAAGDAVVLAAGVGADPGWLELQPARKTAATATSPAFAAIRRSLEGAHDMR
jgi:hypothetical protein